jgi:hypothetical protein
MSRGASYVREAGGADLPEDLMDFLSGTADDRAVAAGAIERDSGRLQLLALPLAGYRADLPAGA